MARIKPKQIMPLSPPEVRRFWRSVSVASKSECWEWMSGKSRGYGYFSARAGGVKRTRFPAHRVAFFIRHGFNPDVARHSCDNKSCCNPAHILNGTTEDNTLDMIARARRQGTTTDRKLTDRQAEEIRKEYESGSSFKKLARKHGVSPGVVEQIIHRKTYVHKEDPRFRFVPPGSARVQS